MSSFDKIKKLTRQLYPTGRAFNMPQGGEMDKLHNALAYGEESAYDDAVAILDHILPDNSNFTADDATIWETRLGMITNSSVPLADRKLAIIRKMNHPGAIPARQSHDYLQNSLQDAGFNVYVYENNPEQSIEQVLLENINAAQLGMGQMNDFQLGDVYSVYSDLFECIQLNDVQMGESNMGECEYVAKIANHINESLDAFFNVGANYRSTFFIGGPTFGSFANVDVERKDEFRQLVLKIKPVQSIAYLFINYV